jgi:hypothetical protein
VNAISDEAAASSETQESTRATVATMGAKLDVWQKTGLVSRSTAPVFALAVRNTGVSVRNVRAMNDAI